MQSNREIISCPLCGAMPMNVVQAKYGIHCEGLCCQSCGVNARNRFYYLGLKKVIERLTGIHSEGLAVPGIDQTPHQLTMLEASSFGFAKLGSRYNCGMDRYGTLTCSDYFEENFQGVKKIDLCDMPFEDKTLDIIAHSHVLEHIEDDQKAIEETFRCLSDRGAFVLGIPVQTDFTFKPVETEFHEDNALVYRRNGWDLITKLKTAGFRVEVYVPPEHLAFWQSEPDPTILAIDNIMVGQKFGIQFARYRELFSSLCNPEESNTHCFSNIWGQLELFVARRNV